MIMHNPQTFALWVSTFILLAENVRTCACWKWDQKDCHSWWPLYWTSCAESCPRLDEIGRYHKTKIHISHFFPLIIQDSLHFFFPSLPEYRQRALLRQAFRPDYSNGVIPSWMTVQDDRLRCLPIQEYLGVCLFSIVSYSQRNCVIKEKHNILLITEEMAKLSETLTFGGSFVATMIEKRQKCGSNNTNRNRQIRIAHSEIPIYIFFLGVCSHCSLGSNMQPGSWTSLQPRRDDQV